MSLTRPSNDSESGITFFEGALVLALFALVCIIAVPFFVSGNNLSDFHTVITEGSEDETATYQEGIDYTGDDCGLEAKLDEPSMLIAFTMTGQDCKLEIMGDQFDGNGFRYESGDVETVPGETYGLQPSANYAFRLCHDDGNITDEDCRIFRLNAV